MNNNNNNNSTPPPPPSLPSHNWNQLHRVLLTRGWTQIITRDERMAYTDGRNRFLLQKSDRLDFVYVMNFCKHIGMTYQEFVTTYREIYSNKEEAEEGGGEEEEKWPE